MTLIVGLNEDSLHRVSTCVWIGLLLFALAFPTHAQEPPNSSSTSAGTPVAVASSTQVEDVASAYRIGRGDVLDIRVFNKPQLSRDSVRVDENGMIIMPLIGEVQAMCKTEKEMARNITSLYLEYQKNPQVDVFIKEYQSQAVAVIGAVRSPGRFQLQRPMRLLELLSYVGGPSEKAGRSIQVIHTGSANAACSDTPSKPTAGTSFSSIAGDNLASYDLRQTLRGDASLNPFVQSGDIITIPEADQIYVVGNVLHPTSIPLTETVTISRALAMAGGIMPDTKSDRVRIVRVSSNGGGKTEMFVDIKAIDQRHAQDIALQANDIIDVPVSGGKRFLRDLVSVIAPTVGALPTRVIR
jgi:polysaccharide export outer membrane protein